MQITTIGCGAALISEMPDTFQSRWIGLWGTQSACAEPDLRNAM